jgi:hypothetical protein
VTTDPPLPHALAWLVRLRNICHHLMEPPQFSESTLLMNIAFPLPVAITTVLCAAVCLVGGCSRGPSRQAAAIEFSRIPQADAGGRETQDIIEGIVTGAQPGQQIVLYAKSGRWWVQPLVTHPFTKLGGKSGMKWTNATHLGTDYVAILVEPGYRPPPVLDNLPKVGGPAGSAVIAVVGTKGAAAPPSKTIEFSGYQWRLRDVPSSRGGANNNYSSKNAWTDESGALHMKIAREGNDWSCAEISLTRSLGYGTYKVTVSDASKLDKAVVFTMFTWDYARPDENNGEMDMEYRHWSGSRENFEYFVSPFYAGQNAIRAYMPPATLIHSLRWEPGRATFRTVRASDPASKVVAENIFTSGIPVHGIESFRMCFYIDRFHGLPSQEGSEVVIEKFEYFP